MSEVERIAKELIAELRRLQARVDELEKSDQTHKKAFSTILHSVGQMKVFGNDRKREIDLIESVCDQSLQSTKEQP